MYIYIYISKHVSMVGSALSVLRPAAAGSSAESRLPRQSQNAPGRGCPGDSRRRARLANAATFPIPAASTLRRRAGAQRPAVQLQE